MMCKRAAAVLSAAFMLLMLCTPSFAAQNTGEVLVVYSDSASDAEKANLQAVVDTLTYTSRTADYLAQSDAAGVISKYSYVIYLAENENAAFDKKLAAYGGNVLLLGTLPQSMAAEGYEIRETRLASCFCTASYTFMGDNTFQNASTLDLSRLPAGQTYTEGTLTANGEEYPLVSGWGGVRYIPLDDYTGSFERALLMQQVTLWLWPYNNKPNSYAQFIVLDNVYPFSDPDKLLEITESLVNQKLPFVISVMPIYQNADFPAMQQFCEVLRYAQANGGAVIMHCPLMQNSLDVDALAQKLTDAAQSYISNGVYPVSLAIPSSWLYNEEAGTVLARYRTLFIYDDDTEQIDIAAARNTFLDNGQQIVSQAISVDGGGIGYLDCCATAVYIDFEQNMKLITATVDAMRKTTVPLKSLWSMNHAVYMNDGGLLTWDGTALEANGERVSLEYTPQAYPENYDYKRTIYYRATANLASQNKYLILFALASVFIFLLSIYLARRQMKKRFFITEPKSPENEAK